MRSISRSDSDEMRTAHNRNHEVKKRYSSLKKRSVDSDLYPTTASSPIGRNRLKGRPTGQCESPSSDSYEDSDRSLKNQNLSKDKNEPSAYGKTKFSRHHLSSDDYSSDNGIYEKQRHGRRTNQRTRHTTDLLSDEGLSDETIRKMRRSKTKPSKRRRSESSIDEDRHGRLSEEQDIRRKCDDAKNFRLHRKENKPKSTRIRPPRQQKVRQSSSNDEYSNDEEVVPRRLRNKAETGGMQYLKGYLSRATARKHRRRPSPTRVGQSARRSSSSSESQTRHSNLKRMHQLAKLTILSSDENSSYNSPVKQVPTRVKKSHLKATESSRPQNPRCRKSSDDSASISNHRVGSSVDRRQPSRSHHVKSVDKRNSRLKEVMPSRTSSKPPRERINSAIRSSKIPHHPIVVESDRFHESSEDFSNDAVQPVQKEMYNDNRITKSPQRMSDSESRSSETDYDDDKPQEKYIGHHEGSPKKIEQQHGQHESAYAPYSPDAALQELREYESCGPVNNVPHYPEPAKFKDQNTTQWPSNYRSCSPKSSTLSAAEETATFYSVYELPRTFTPKLTKKSSILPKFAVRFDVCKKLPRRQPLNVKIVGDVKELGNKNTTYKCHTLYPDPDDRQYENYFESEFIEFANVVPGQQIRYRYFVWGEDPTGDISNGKKVDEEQFTGSLPWRAFTVPDCKKKNCYRWKMSDKLFNEMSINALKPVLTDEDSSYESSM